EGFEAGGKIKCPRYEEVCTIAANGSSLVVPRVLSGAEQAKGAALESPGAGAPAGAAGGDSPGPEEATEAAAAAAAASPDVPAPPTPTPAASVNGSAVQKKLDGAARQLGSDAGAAAAAVGCSHFVLLAAAAVAMLPS
ncbi:surface protease GP63, partial [Trypanosoma conorhini]